MTPMVGGMTPAGPGSPSGSDLGKTGMNMGNMDAGQMNMMMQQQMA